MTEPTIIAVVITVVFLGALCQGLTGFGFSLIAVPILTVFISPKIAVPMTTPLVIVLCAMVIYSARKHVDLRRIWPLMVSGVSGIPLGVYVLVFLDADILTVFIGAVALVFALLLLKGYSRKIENEKLAFLPVGLMSGFLTGSTTLGGPPVILFFANQGVDKQTFRANIIAFFGVMVVACALSFGLSGLFTAKVVSYALLGLPAVLVGTLLGIRFSHRVDERRFRAVTLLVIMVASVVSIVSGLGDLL